MDEGDAEISCSGIWEEGVVGSEGLGRWMRKS